MASNQPSKASKIVVPVQGIAGPGVPTHVSVGLPTAFGQPQAAHGAVLGVGPQAVAAPGAGQPQQEPHVGQKRNRNGGARRRRQTRKHRSSKKRITRRR